MAKNFKDLTEQEILALAITLEEEDGRILCGSGAVPCASDAEVFTLNLTNGNTSFVTDVDLSSTAVVGAARCP